MKFGIVFLVLGLAGGFFIGKAMTADSATEASATPTTTKPVSDPGYYALGYSIADSSNFNAFDWNPQNLEDFFRGINDSIGTNPPRAETDIRKFPDLNRRLAEQFFARVPLEKRLPATIAPLVNAYTAGAYAQSIHTGEPFTADQVAIPVRFTSAVIDRQGFPMAEISSSITINLSEAEKTLRDTILQAGQGGRVVAVVPVRFLNADDLLLSQLHPDETLLYTLLIGETGDGQAEVDENLRIRRSIRLQGTGNDYGAKRIAM